VFTPKLGPLLITGEVTSGRASGAKFRYKLKLDDDAYDKGCSFS